MKVSYNWLQKHFSEKLPSPEKLDELFTFHSFEVEDVESGKDDTIFDIKVLPDRAPYALSHTGIAEEIRAVSGMELKQIASVEIRETEEKPLIEVKEPSACRRYIGRTISNLNMKETPAELRSLLESVGQRSINPIVDATNYIMLDMGQPLHAFDADKVKGAIMVRKAEEGEKITVLDGKEVSLDPTILVIADEEGPLAIAGVKGGKRAEVTGQTKKIILESANFDSVSVRKTSIKVGIRNDSSKRFENGITPEYAFEGMERATLEILRIMPGARAGKISDFYPVRQEKTIIETSAAAIASTLGVAPSVEEIRVILGRLDIGCEEKVGSLRLTVPYRRLDLRIPEDIAEEVGRIYGYDKVPDTLPAHLVVPRVNKQFYYSEKIKNILCGRGFSEVSLYALVPKGDFEVAYPLASDKKALRTNLSGNIANALALNSHNADLLGLEEIRIFEIGKVFPAEGEHASLAIGIKNMRKKDEKEKEKIKKVRDNLLRELNADTAVLCAADDAGGIISLGGKTIGITNNTEGVLELNLDLLIESLSEPKSYDDLRFGKAPDIKYEKFSVYPYIVRDIAAFVPADAAVDHIVSMIKKEGTELLVKGPILFDDFTKEGRRSLAFRMIFQSNDRTLTDMEVNTIMEKIYGVLKAMGYEVR